MTQPSFDDRWFGTEKNGFTVRNHMPKPLAIVVHHTTSTNPAGSISWLATRTEDGAKGFGYHYIIPTSNSRNNVYRLLPDTSIVWHAGNVNNRAIGVSLAAADDAAVAQDPRQVQMAVNLVRYLQQKYNIDSKNVFGHGEIWQYCQRTSKQPSEGRTVVNIIRNNAPLDVPALFEVLKAAGRRPILGVSNGLDGATGRRSTPGGRAYQPVPVSGISPYISALDSFHPNIQYELTKRTLASEMANAYTPFVKLTSLTEVLKPDLPDSIESAWCPSLGIHGEKTQTFEDIYTTRDNKSMIGYATAGPEGKDKTKVIVRDAGADAQTIPVPGIIKVSAERSTAGPMGVRGGLFKADISILAYSVGQVDTLLRYFLRPATRVVLELGRMSAVPPTNRTYGRETVRNFTPYNWNKSKEAITNEFTNFIENTESQRVFVQQYTYDNYGNYEIFVGYVVKFNLKYNKDNTYVIDLTIHSVQQFELPTKHTGVKSICANAATPCAAMDVQEYFSDTYSWKENTFSKLMDASVTNANNVVRIGQPTPVPGGADGASTQGGTRENEYFVTWQFFIEQILNDPTYGIISVLGDNTQIKNLLKLGLPRATRLTTPTDKYGLLANEVGYHPNLRSTTPSVMVINNPVAQAAYEGSLDKKIYISAARGISLEEQELQQSSESNTTISNSISSGARFSNHLGSSTEAGAGWLQEGVWLNTAAIKQAFTSTDTVTAAMSMLLNMMNTATEGYWNLQLYSTETGTHVIDMGLSKPITKGTEPAALPELPTPQILTSLDDIDLGKYRDSTTDPAIPKYLYVFNRNAVRFERDDIGSELLDMNVEFNLPQVIAVQAIAGVGGPAQKSLLQSIDIDELNDISLIKTFNTCDDNTNSVCAENTSCYNADTVQNMEKDIAGLRAQLQAIELQTNIAEVAGGPIFGGFAGVLSGFTTREQRAKLAEEIKTKEEQIGVQLRNQNPNVVNSLREYADLGTAIELIELNPSSMMKKLNLDSRNDVTEGRKTPIAHAFSSSNLTKTVVDVTLPGIGGINLFQSFLVGRAPSILDRGFYVVTKITHEFSSQSGWITKIQGRFRFRPDITSSGKYDVCDALASKGAGTTAGGGSTTAGAASTGTGAPQRAFGQLPIEPVIQRDSRTGLPLDRSLWPPPSTPIPGASRGTQRLADTERALGPSPASTRLNNTFNSVLRTTTSPSEIRIVAAQQRALTSIKESNLSRSDKRREEAKINALTLEAIARFRRGTPLSTVLLTIRFPSAPPGPSIGPR